MRKDSIVKYEILQEIVKEYFIPFVFDDRDQVVRMWREAGLRCLQVASGNF
jgi:phosphoserine phosphatase